MSDKLSARKRAANTKYDVEFEMKGWRASGGGREAAGRPVAVDEQGVHVRGGGKVGGRRLCRGLEAHLTDWLGETLRRALKGGNRGYQEVFRCFGRCTTFMRWKQNLAAAVACVETGPERQRRRGTSEGQQRCPQHVTADGGACSAALWLLRDIQTQWNSLSSVAFHVKHNSVFVVETPGPAEAERH
jgi:hypothetical protein